jgi:hypothetical protein
MLATFRSRVLSSRLLSRNVKVKISLIHFPFLPSWNTGPLFGVSVITHRRHTAGLFWTSDQPVAKTSTYTGQHNIQTQETNIHVPSGIRTLDPSNRPAAELRLRPRGHWNRPNVKIYKTIILLVLCMGVKLKSLTLREEHRLRVF